MLYIYAFSDTKYFWKTDLSPREMKQVLSKRTGRHYFPLYIFLRILNFEPYECIYYLLNILGWYESNFSLKD